MSDPQRTVLVVDDREENRYILCHTLTRAGFSTVEAATGKRALELSRQLPDVIVLDVRLPDILGYEVCRRLKSNPQTRHIPVLQLSAAFLTAESKLYALESGADSYLIQPADPLVLVATVRSLMRLREAEKQAQAAAKQWAATFDALSEGVAIVQDGVVQRCNRAMTELLGASYGQIESQSYAALLRQRFSLESPLAEDGTAVETQVRDRFFRLGAAALPVDGSAGGTMLIVADITPQKQAEQALLLNERLAATGRVAHIIAHEINNPLEAITNLVYLAGGAPELTEETRGFLAATAAQVDRVSQITRQVLSFNRETRDAIKVPIAELVEDVLALSCRMEAEKRFTVQWDADRSLQAVGYPARLRQVFANIIRNAIEASPRDGVLAIRIRRSQLRAPGGMAPAIRITIADCGSGIPEHLRTKIFEPFFTTKGQGGSGIGLWLTAAIVGEHGGRIQMRSRAEAGTSFSILLPSSASGLRR